MESPQPWIIQVYSEDDPNSQNFSGFWDEFAEEHNYLNFGRINYNSQKKLLRKLPFAIDDLPAVISVVPGEHSELLDFWGDRSPNAELKEFLRNSFGHHYQNITQAEFFETYPKNEDKGKIYLIGSVNIPIPYLYLSTYYKNEIKFYRTEHKQKRSIYKRLNNDKIFGVFTPDSTLQTKPKFFEGQPTKHNLLRMMNYVNFVQIPELFRYSFQDHCENHKTYHTEKGTIVCIIAIQGENYTKVIEKFKEKINELDDLVYEMQIKKQDKFNNYIQKI